MQRAWVVLLAGCGFQSPPGGSNDSTMDAMLDAPSTDVAPAFCWTIADTDYNFRVSACPTALVDTIDVAMDVPIDTDANSVPASGLGCAPLSGKSFAVCALAARSITIESGKTLSAYGTRPLALLGHAITINGTIDVASHASGPLSGPRGPASDLPGCNPGQAADFSGGGQGGTYDGAGGNGGDQYGPVGQGGLSGTSIALSLRGGCAGEGGGHVGEGGHSGGAVWVALDTGTLVLGDNAKINASGAGGAGGTLVGSQGGSGGGSGGLIVLQAPAITLGNNTAIFANGGGGGGAAGTAAGMPGGDPGQPSSGGSRGNNGGGTSGSRPGNGGTGFPQVTAGEGGTGGTYGGGGGGGGAGAILVAGPNIDGPKVSPSPKYLTH